MTSDLKTPQNKQQHSQKVSVLASSGPLPMPHILEGYQKLYPNAAEIIFENFKLQTQHRIELEKSQLEEHRKQAERDHQASMSAIRLTNRNSIFAFILALICLLSGFILVLFKNNIGSYILLISEVTGLAGLFIYYQYKHRKKQTNKN